MTDSRRRFAVACAIGAGISLAIFFAFLAINSRGFFGSAPVGLGGFYDAQARALLHGHWNAPGSSFFIERINLDGEYYMYFGPWPSLLRMPLLLITSRLDGKLTSASLLLACVTLLVAAGFVLGEVHTLRGSAASLSRREQVGVACFMILVGTGSSVVFLSASAWVYDEAILWGAAWAVWSLYCVVAYLRRPSRTLLILAAATSTLAIMSRQGSGAIGAVLLGSLFVVHLLGTRSQPRIRRVGAWLGRLTGVDDRLDSRRPWPIGLAALTPLVAFAYVNVAKFGSVFNVPFDKQDLILRTIPARQEVIRRNGSGLVSIKEAPTNLVAYLRPDGFSFHRLFPFVDFGPTPTVIGNVARDTQTATASLTVTTTLLLVLTVVGLAIAFVPTLTRRAGLNDIRVLRLPALAAGIGVVPTVIFPGVTERYKADLTPLLVLMGGVGLYAVAAFVRGNGSRRLLVVGVAAILMTFNVWANLALTLNFQRGYHNPSAAGHGAYVRDQITWTKRLGLKPSVHIVHWDRSTKRPAAGPIGSFLVINNCAGLMESDGQQWLDLGLTDPRATCEELTR